MKKLLKTIVITLVAIVLIAFLGCSAMMDGVTPCFIQQQVIEYADEPATSFLPFSTLRDAKRINVKLDYVHELRQIATARIMEDDVIEYGYVKDVHFVDIKDAKEFQQSVFSPTSPIGLLVPGLGFGFLGVMGGGRYLRSPREKELEKKNGN